MKDVFSLVLKKRMKGSLKTPYSEVAEDMVFSYHADFQNERGSLSSTWWGTLAVHRWHEAWPVAPELLTMGSARLMMSF